MSKLSGEISKKELVYDELFIPENEDAKNKKNEKFVSNFLSNFTLKNPFTGLFGKKKSKTVEY